ncbi:MAG: hypothetical protein Q9219_005744 [cf. Caloplaca sp. 3 TL-2023]
MTRPAENLSSNEKLMQMMREDRRKEYTSLGVVIPPLVLMTQEQRAEFDRDYMPRTSMKYPTSMGEVTFTLTEEDEIYIEAAERLPKKLRELEPAWPRHTPSGPQVFVWKKIQSANGYKDGFQNIGLEEELDKELAPLLNEVIEKKAREKLTGGSV